MEMGFPSQVSLYLLLVALMPTVTDKAQVCQLELSL
jgi:hypothetical protein